MKAKGQITLVVWAPPTKWNMRIEAGDAAGHRDYAHAVFIDGIQRAAWCKRTARRVWELLDIDGNVLKASRVHKYTDRHGNPAERLIAQNISTPNIGMMEATTKWAFEHGHIPTPAQMKVRRKKLAKDKFTKARAMWLMDRADAIRASGVEMHNALMNIELLGLNAAEPDQWMREQMRAEASAVLKKIVLPDEPMAVDFPAEPDGEGVWICPASVNGKDT